MLLSHVWHLSPDHAPAQSLQLLRFGSHIPPCLQTDPGPGVGELGGVGFDGPGAGVGLAGIGSGLIPDVDVREATIPLVPDFRAHPEVFTVNASQPGKVAQREQHETAGKVPG
jgi:hypothetical protein